MFNARIGFKQLPGFAAANKEYAGVRESLLSGIEDDAGDRDIRAEGDAGEHEYIPDNSVLERWGRRFRLPSRLRAASGRRNRLPHLVDSAVSRHEQLRVEFRLDGSERLGKHCCIGVA